MLPIILQAASTPTGANACKDADVLCIFVTHHANWLVYGTFVLAVLGYAVPTLLRTRRYRRLWREKLSVDPPEFDPKSTSAASLTAITSATGGLLGAKLLPDDNKALTHNLAYLGVFFAALAVIALALYYSPETRRVSTYMMVDVLLLWGAVGAVSTFTIMLMSLDATEFLTDIRLLFLVLVLIVLVFMFLRRSGSTVKTVCDLARTPEMRQREALAELTKTVRQLLSQQAAARALIADAASHSTDPLAQQALALAAARLAAARVLMPQFVTHAQQLVSGYADTLIIAATDAAGDTAALPEGADRAGATTPAPPPSLTEGGVSPPLSAGQGLRSVHWKVG